MNNPICRPDQPAFTAEGYGGYGHTLTKRELFSALILAALMSNDKYDLRNENAKIAVSRADQLISTLNQP